MVVHRVVLSGLVVLHVLAFEELLIHVHGLLFFFFLLAHFLSSTVHLPSLGIFLQLLAGMP